MIVVADTSPVNYLILIQAIDLLPKMYGRVIIPGAVRDELLHPSTPLIVKDWIRRLPAWLEVRAEISKDLSGHFKTGHMWSGQNRPTRMAQDPVLLPRQERFRQVGLA